MPSRCLPWADHRHLHLSGPVKISFVKWPSAGLAKRCLVPGDLTGTKRDARGPKP